MTYYTAIDSPFGALTLAAEESQLTALHLEGDRYFTTVPSDWVRRPQHPIFQTASRQLNEYATGTRRTFELDVLLQGTPFQQAVWEALQTIPPGTTTTYQQLAQLVGRPGAARAVGTAVGRNPICIIIPCHRVLASGGGLGGYVAGLEHKRRLLAIEQASLPSH